ncbi:MAG: 23S rRNA (uracil(1939)-C(5))-methyltransferase RlmD [Acidobacteriota bacterium]|nr:23S rRNA (uracil(1939)-C(5))-methyltransferase RlmD [Acidobacteriota bacterium]
MQCSIEKLIYGGDGLARIPAQGDERRGKTVFIPYVLPGETVEARVVEERKGFIRAEATEILTPSPARIAPLCPHFTHCGGCSYQHLDYAGQVEQKALILRETLQRGAKVELPEVVTHTAEPWGFRNRSRMKFAFEPEFALGYYRHGSHELEAVRECPISSPLINRAVSLLWGMAKELSEQPLLREVQFFANHDDSALLLELFVHYTAKPPEFAPLAKLLREKMPEIAGVAIFAGVAPEGDLDDGSFEAAKQLLRAGAPYVEGSRHMVYQVGEHEYRVSAGSFFQTNRFLVAELVELVTAGREGKSVMDLFSGVGLFTLPLARHFARVTSVEIAPYSYGDLEANATGGNMQKVRGTTEDFLRTARGRWDLAVVDPPRTGLGERAARFLGALQLPRITYVSCDPATLARDLGILLAAGYTVEAAHMVDLFPQTCHMESILQLVRTN